MVPIAILFLISVAIAALGARLPAIVAAGYALCSVVTFAVYARDKSAARNDGWRTRESTLHILSLVGGWPGAAIAQKVLHHKSRKRPFQVVFWASAVANCTALIWFVCAY